MTSGLHQYVFRSDLGALKSAARDRSQIDSLDSACRTALMYAATDRNVGAMAILIDAGAKVDLQDSLGNTSLHYAAQAGDPEAVRLLLTSGAVVDIQDIHGNTPLWRAIFNSFGRGDIITMLIHAGANRYCINKHGKTPMDLANTISNYNVLKFLQ